jgi:hypothetical protein
MGKLNAPTLAATPAADNNYAVEKLRAKANVMNKLFMRLLLDVFVKSSGPSSRRSGCW